MLMNQDLMVNLLMRTPAMKLAGGIRVTFMLNFYCTEYLQQQEETTNGVVGLETT